MFNLFKKSPPGCPVSDDTRKWIEEAFLWLKNEFGGDVITGKKILQPTDEDFPIVYDGTHESAIETLKIIAKNMEIDQDEILLNFYRQGISEIGSGGMGGNKIFIKHEKDAKLSSGLYHGRNADGKYEISLEEKNLKDPVGLVGTLAHELSHIKLLGEERLIENNEHLTDINTIIFGFGIFNANCSFRYSSGFDQWGYRKVGYLTQIEWGYALAVYAYMRSEHAPAWASYLSETVRGSFRRSEQFIAANKEKLLC